MRKLFITLTLLALSACEGNDKYPDRTVLTVLEVSGLSSETKKGSNGTGAAIVGGLLFNTPGAIVGSTMTADAKTINTCSVRLSGPYGEVYVAKAPGICGTLRPKDILHCHADRKTGETYLCSGLRAVTLVSELNVQTGEDNER